MEVHANISVSKSNKYWPNKVSIRTLLLERLNDIILESNAAAKLLTLIEILYKKQAERHAKKYCYDELHYLVDHCVSSEAAVIEGFFRRTKRAVMKAKTKTDSKGKQTVSKEETIKTDVYIPRYDDHDVFITPENRERLKALNKRIDSFRKKMDRKKINWLDPDCLDRCENVAEKMYSHVNLINTLLRERRMSVRNKCITALREKSPGVAPKDLKITTEMWQTTSETFDNEKLNVVLVEKITKHEEQGPYGFELDW